MAEPQTVSPTPEAAPAATPAMPEPAPAATGTAETTGSDAQATAPVEGQGEAAPSEDTFYSGDPKSLPPELRKHYDNMLRDYKKKTSETAELRKRAEAYEAISRDKRFVDYWTRVLNGEQQAQQQIEQKKQDLEVSDDEFEKALTSKQEFLKLMAKVSRESNSDLAQKLEAAQQELQTRRASESIEEFAEAGHQDIYDLENYGFISYQYRVDPKIPLESAYANAKQVYDDIYKKGYETARKELQANMQKKAAASTEVPVGSPANAYSGPDPKKLTAAEALAYAKRGIVVPQS